MAAPTPPPGFVLLEPSQTPPPPPGFQPIPDSQTPQQRGGMLDKLFPEGLPREPAAPNEPRFGDFLKPVFQGQNPIAETYDRIAPGFDTSSDRPIGQRAVDTVNWAASVPLQAVGAPTIGSMVESATGLTGLKESEQSFVENNPDLLFNLGYLGEVAPGMTRGLGQGAIPPPRVSGPMAFGPERPAHAALPDSATFRARRAAQDMEDLGIRQHGPAIAQAARQGEGVGALSKVVESLPVVGRPLQKATQEFVESGAAAGENIARGYAPSGNIQRAGETVRGYFDRFRNERAVPRDALEAMDDVSLAELATKPPRDVGSLKTAADARYEEGWRLIPEWMRKGASRDSNVRLMGDLPETRKVIQSIADKNLNLINEQRLGRRVGVAEESASELPTRFKAGSIQKEVLPLRGGIIGRAIEDIQAGNWKGSLQTMRDLRSELRRLDSKTPDKEGNTLNKANLARLQSAVLKDMYGLFERIVSDATKKGDARAAAAFRRASDRFRTADRFYARYAEAMEGMQRITKATRDEGVIQTIRVASQKGTGGDLNLIAQIRRMAPDAVMDDVASALISEMGRPTGTASGAAQDVGFSPGRFATAWNNMHPAAKRAIFGHRGDLSKALEKYARVVQHMADYEKLANTSRSGQHSIIGMAILAGPAAIANNIMTGLAGAAGMYAVAKWMASPYYVNWLTRTMLIQEQMSRGGDAARSAASAMLSHVRDFSRHVAADKSLPPELSQAFLGAVFQAVSDRPGNAQN